jgi:hypothetical protein
VGGTVSQDRPEAPKYVRYGHETLMVYRERALAQENLTLDSTMSGSTQRRVVSKRDSRELVGCEDDAGR